VLEKAQFPREKVCGDGLTPRGTRRSSTWASTSARRRWLHNQGLRVIGGGMRLHLDWPDLTTFPSYGLVRRGPTSISCSSRRRSRPVPCCTSRPRHRTGLRQGGRVTGVAAKAGPDKREAFYRAPVVISCEGVSGRIAQQLGLHRNDKRPMGVAVRRYYTSPRTHDDYLESWLELHDGPINAMDGGEKLLPGYGWIFGMATATVNVGLGVLNSSAGFQKTDYAAC